MLCIIKGSPAQGLTILALAALLLGACSQDSGDSGPQTEAAGNAHSTTPANQTAARRFDAPPLDMPTDTIVGAAQRNAMRQAYFGDLHVHTKYSFDAYAFGTVATPYDAYRYAQGEPIRHPSGFVLQLSQPLDFYAVTDHAMFLGAVSAAADTSTEFSQEDHVTDLHDINADDNMNSNSLSERVNAFTTFLPETFQRIINGETDVDLLNGIAKEAWADIVAAAEAHYQPGEFTTFVAYEYTSSTDDRGNLHRNVIFKDSDKLPAMPFSRLHSQNPEGLWDWMDGLRAQGIEAMAIPHNPNGSNGAMFKMVDWDNNPIDREYADQRLRNEPLVELTQVKGTSETHPLLSPEDEWANFEIMPYRIATTQKSAPSGSYAREALLNGLVLAESGITNAYQFGFVGASDTHNAASSLTEKGYFSKVGLLDGTSAWRGSVPLTPAESEVIKAAGRVQVKLVEGQEYATGAYETWGASGLTGVWAERNTREALYRAFRRKETFATSGPRMKVRLFAGYGLEDNKLADQRDLTQAYAQGASMGSELHLQEQGTPTLLVEAIRDPNSAALQRLQIVKGWTENGAHREQVYDVACSDKGEVDEITHRCPDNGARVDLASCAITPDRGAGRLMAAWKDPDFDASERAFYYARALENPTCRWSTWDALQAGVMPRSDLLATLQERVWSSPIWMLPESD
tara:strand:+ start:2083 stop:4140 length:2058 start_codon:yes stop_codon:yes gene_type:complete